MKIKQIRQKFVKTESGRSMVEMLGVLAVMGVLSVGGIGGYTMAMRKHRANEVAAELNALAHECSRFYTAQSEGDCEVDGLGGNLGYATVDSTLPRHGDEAFKATVTGMEKDLCQALKVRLASWTQAKDEGADNTCAAVDNNALNVLFKNDLSAWDGDETVGAPCTGEDEAECGEAGYCHNGACKTCPEGQVAQGDKCGCAEIVGCSEYASDCLCVACAGDVYNLSEDKKSCDSLCSDGTKPNAEGTDCEYVCSEACEAPNKCLPNGEA